MWKDVDGKDENGPYQIPEDAGLEHPPPDEVPWEEEHPLRAVGA